jgi:PPM family protein phosphatase
LSDELSLGGLQDQLHLLVAGHTHPGQSRTENQDNYLIADFADGNGILLRSAGGGNSAGAEMPTGAKGALLMVADGMGGAAAGRLASNLACTFVVAELREGWQQDRLTTPRQFAFRLREAVEKANHNIYEHAQRNPACSGMGTTTTAVGVFEDYLYIAHVGDSRAYLVRNGTATQLTHDQSYVQRMVDAGAMTLEDAELSAHGNMLLQALGSQRTVEVDLTYQPVRRGDLVLICSDGLHRMVRPHEIAAAARGANSPADLCAELITLTNERGAPDNVTVVAARLEGAALRVPSPDDVVTRRPFQIVDNDVL